MEPAVQVPKKPRKRQAKSVTLPEVRRARRIKSGTISSGFGVEAGGGISQQIPQEVIVKMANEVIAPPLGERSFEEFAAMLLESTEFAACVYQTAIDVAGVGWHLDPMSQDEEMDESEIDTATAFFEAPNPNATLSEIVKAAMIDLRAIGNGWIEVLRQNNEPGGLPSGLAHAPGLAMRLRSNLKGFVMLGKSSNLHAYFRALFSDPSDDSSIDPVDGHVLNEMIYFREYHPASPWYGVPSIVPAMRAIRGNMLSAERSIRYFTNRAFPEYVITIEGQTDNIPIKELDALEEDIAEHFKNLIKGDDYKTLLQTLPVGVTLKLERLSAPFDYDMLRPYRIDNRDEIVRSQRMMPNRIGIIEAGNIGGGTGESQIEIYKSSLIKPLQEMVERVFNAILHSHKPLGFGLTTVRFKFDEIDSIDEAREAQIAAILSQTGWLDVNEGRAYITQFLKLKLAQKDEPWADLPLQVLLPQLAQFFDIDPSLQMEPGITPGISQFGTLELAPRPTLGKPPERIAVDKAYRRFRERQEKPVEKVVGEISKNGS